MKTKLWIMILFIVTVITACAPVPVTSAISTSTFASILPVAQPTYAMESGSNDSQVDSVVEAYQDFNVGGSWYVTLHPGEKAFLDKDKNILKIQDTQGRVILESLDEEHFRFYAREDDYNVIIGSGSVMLKAGYSYTQKKLSINWDKEVVEVRQTSNDQLIGYILLLRNYNSNGAFTGNEIPAAIIDSNGDGILSITELDTALSSLRADAILVGKANSLSGEAFREKINSAYDSINNGDIADAYLKIKQVQTELANTPHTANATTGGTLLFIILVAVLLFVGIIWMLSRMSRKGRPKKRVKRTIRTTTGLKTRAPGIDAKIRNPVNPTPEVIPEKLIANQKKTCPKCGYPSRSDDLYCLKCGEKLT